MIPTDKDLWFLPLGGCGEIGMNLNLFGHNGSWLMVDCGITFEDSVTSRTGNRVEMPDPLFIANRHEALAGIIATHAHEDHIGALPHLWEQLRCPIYTTPFTRNVVARKFAQAGIRAPLVTVHPGETIEIGPFKVTWVPITHSTPETNGLLIDTPAGRVLHTADWKVDPAPVVGEPIQPKLFQSIGDRGVGTIICDSTNAPLKGSSTSESTLFDGLLAAVQASPQRVVVACFSSNVARLQTIGNVAHVAGRYIGLLGRSLINMHGCARGAGYLADNFNLVQSNHLGYMPPDEVLAIATGSQGEVGAALYRLAQDSHPDVSLAAGDHVIFSSKTIPGNEIEVASLIAMFEARDIRVTQNEFDGKPIHATGHPCAEELQQMYQWIRPRVAVPVHGEARHMDSNARIAAACGVPVQLRGQNGDLFDLVLDKVKRSAVPVGRLWFDERKRVLEKV